MLDLSPTITRILKLGTAMFLIAVVAAVVMNRPNATVAAKKPAAEAQTSYGPNDRTLVTLSSNASR